MNWCCYQSINTVIGAHIDLVLHVSLLNKCEDNQGDSANYIPLPLQTLAEEPILQPISVLKHRTILKKG